MTPREMIDDLKVLELSGVGSKVIPNGLPEFRGTRPFQEFYDEKYFTKEAPRPQRPAATPTPVARESSKSSRIAPTNSFAASSTSLSSTAGKEEKEKKKRRGLFHF